jgi:hypothetical protein
MPGAAEELARLKWLLENGKIPPSEPCKLILPRIEAKKRVRNTEGRTRLIVQLDTPATYSDFAAQFARYKEQAGNVQIAYSIMLRLLAQLSDESIRKLAADEQIDTGSLADA